MPDYIYAVSGDTLFVNLYVASRAETTVGTGRVVVTERTGYPWQGDISVRLEPSSPRRFEVRLRIPGWARNEPVPSTLYRYADDVRPAYELRVNGTRTSVTLDRGFASIESDVGAGRPGDAAPAHAGAPRRGRRAGG